MDAEEENKVLAVLLSSIDNNHNYLNQTKSHESLNKILSELRKVIEESYEKIEVLKSFAGQYDFDADTPGNGYRSFIDLWMVVIQNLTEICKLLEYSRKSFFFNSKYYERLVLSVI